MRAARALSAAAFAALTMALAAQQQKLNELDNDVKRAEGVVGLTSR